ncbi:MAG: type I-B CRISPR-associated protein Cas7/Csh2 [Candidatus Nanoarchaeia archaeon]|nr:type I-B CRISPR-associated protein Cas7/Csh2 [Candidatus Nanoarchaeia archaeon]
MEKTEMKRAEILFLYDVSWANPNGDPVDENKPRIDEETGLNIVTDVRLKRTIRDYLKDFKKQDIFIQEITDENGVVETSDKRASTFDYSTNNILDKCIDIRLFGSTITIKKGKTKNKKEKNVQEALIDTEEAKSSEENSGNIALTGPVQFQMGVSLHKVKLHYSKGTGAFASKEGATQKTFREEYVLPYSLIGFYGIVNENAAKHTQLKDEDIELLMEAIWNGTKNLISRSKIGQQPRLLMKITYKENNYHIGELNKTLKLEFNEGMNDFSIRTPEDYKINISKLKEKLQMNKERIDKIEYIVDSELKFTEDLDAILKEFNKDIITKLTY